MCDVVWHHTISRPAPRAASENALGAFMPSWSLHSAPWPPDKEVHACHQMQGIATCEPGAVEILSMDGEITWLIGPEWGEVREGCKGKLTSAALSSTGRERMSRASAGWPLIVHFISASGWLNHRPAPSTYGAPEQICKQSVNSHPAAQV